jgi:calcineurin-like phosphoesterase family protein
MRFFTSDSHIGHTNILTLGDGRPFRDLAHMHSVLLKNFWAAMGPEDELWHLGDAALGNFEDTVKILAAFPGDKKFLVPGNHDKVFPRLNTATRIERFKPMYENAGYKVLELHPLITLEIDGEPLEVRLSHVPYSPERYSGRTDKLAFARPEDDGKWLIHGHTHSAEKASEHPREIHVGVDANAWAPVSEATIIERIRKATHA